MLDTAATYRREERDPGGFRVENKPGTGISGLKSGMYKNPDGSREIDGDPDRIIRSCDESLSRLGTDVIDLFYLHRSTTESRLRNPWGRSINSFEERSGTLGFQRLVSQPSSGQVVTAIHALQSEYSLWSRRVEDGILKYCRDHGIALVAYSPVGRGFLAGGVRKMSQLSERDIRHGCRGFKVMRSRTTESFGAGRVA